MIGVAASAAVCRNERAISVEGHLAKFLIAAPACASSGNPGLVRMVIDRETVITGSATSRRGRGPRRIAGSIRLLDREQLGTARLSEDKYGVDH